LAAIYLIPSLLAEDGVHSIHPNTMDAVKKCQVIFAENQRTARRFLKLLWKTYAPSQEIIIDNFEWHTIDKEQSPVIEFKKAIKENKNIAILSEAGCPAVADPGQSLVALAQEMNIPVHPLVGPNSILLALMASGMNGQQFRFAGYLPIDEKARAKQIKELEQDSLKNNCTQIFIETPYRNNQLFQALSKNCNAQTRLCIAVDLTASTENIKTMAIKDWQKNNPALHKRPAIFLLYAGN
jgi:16S rRNA (cytidine1402-2'-O)-methyltransferase